MIVEFAGVPGIGKSTMYRAVDTVLRESLLTPLDPTAVEREFLNAKFYSDLRASAWYPKLVRGLYFIGTRLRLTRRALTGGRFEVLLPGRASSAAYWLEKDRRLAQYAAAALPDSLYYVDEGLVQHSAAVLVWGGSKWSSLVHAMIDSQVGQALTVVHVSGDLNEAVERFAAREYPHTWPRNLHPADLRETLANFDRQVRLVLSIWKDAGARIVETHPQAANTIAQSILEGSLSSGGS